MTRAATGANAGRGPVRGSGVRRKLLDLVARLLSSTKSFTYPVDLAAQDGGFVVTFPDLPFGITAGDTVAEAMAHASDAIETVFMSLIADRRDIPPPSPARGRPTVAVPPLTAAKIGLYRAMREAEVSKAEMGRRLGCHPAQVDRLLDLRHASRVDQIEAALRALGKRLVIDVQGAA